MKGAERVLRGRLEGGWRECPELTRHGESFLEAVPASFAETFPETFAETLPETFAETFPAAFEVAFVKAPSGAEAVGLVADRCIRLTCRWP